MSAVLAAEISHSDKARGISAAVAAIFCDHCGFGGGASAETGSVRATSPLPGMHTSAHISHDKSIQHSELLSVVRAKLHDRFGIDHLTIQMETLDHEAEAVYVCETGTKCFEHLSSLRQSRTSS